MKKPISIWITPFILGGMILLYGFIRWRSTANEFAPTSVSLNPTFAFTF